MAQASFRGMPSYQSTILMTLILLANSSFADGPDLTSAPGYSQLRRCGRNILLSNAVNQFGCSTNDCLCQEVFSSVLFAVSTAAVSACSSTSVDVTSALAAFVGYCTAWHYLIPTIAQSISVVTPVGNIQTININNAPGFASIRTCERNVLESNAINGLGCSTNDCLCRPDIRSDAIVAVSIAALSACSGDQIAVTAVTSALNGYCSEAGYGTEAGQVVTTNSPAGSTSVAAGASPNTALLATSRATASSPTAASTGALSSSSASPSPSSSSHGMSAGDKAAIAGTVVGVVAILVAVLIYWLSKRDGRRQASEFIRQLRELIHHPPGQHRAESTEMNRTRHSWGPSVISDLNFD